MGSGASGQGFLAGLPMCAGDLPFAKGPMSLTPRSIAIDYSFSLAYEFIRTHNPKNT
jgi:hypothetical protein